MGLQQLMKIVEELLLGKVVNPAVEEVGNSPDGSGIRLHSLRLHAVELEKFLVFLVQSGKMCANWRCGVHCCIALGGMNDKRAFSALA